jgi:alanine-synthesizing transaminase
MSATRSAGSLARRAQELERQGYEIVSLNIGNPGAVRFPHAGDLRLAMIENLQRVRGLLPPEGHLPGARGRRAAAAGARRARRHDRDHVFIGNGVSELIDLTCVRCSTAATRC